MTSYRKETPRPPFMHCTLAQSQTVNDAQLLQWPRHFLKYILVHKFTSLFIYFFGTGVNLNVGL
jgi:hypothetical protein